MVMTTFFHQEISLLLSKCNIFPYDKDRLNPKGKDKVPNLAVN